MSYFVYILRSAEYRQNRTLFLLTQDSGVTKIAFPQDV